MRPLLLSFAILSLVGCSSLERLKSRAPEANDFQSTIASEYLGFAQSEAEQGYKESAEHFASKGLLALDGKEAALEALPDALSAVDRDMLDSARAPFLDLLSDDVKRVVPQTAARTQVMYDCMVAQTLRHSESRELCAEEFLRGLIEMEKVSTTLAVGEGESRVLVFEPEQIALLEKNAAMVAGIAEYVADKKNYIVALEGHADSKKAKRVFQKRAAEIRKAFVKNGVNAKRIRIEGSGSAKAVHLSHSEDVLEPNAIKISVRVLKRMSHGKEKGQ